MASEPLILGISASHNGAACLLRGSEIVVAIQEERLTREKGARIRGADPSCAVAYCLEHAGITAADLSLVAISAQRSIRAVENDITLQPQLRVGFHKTPTLAVPHHLAHAASAFATSGFSSAAVLVVDGLGSPGADLTAGERAVAVPPPDDGWESISIYSAAEDGLTPLHKQMTPGGRWLVPRASGMASFGSLGGMYSAVARQIFGDSMEAGKVMGLAAYGVADTPIDDFLTVGSDAILEFHDAVPPRFDHNHRWPELRTEYQNLSASVQAALERALLSLARKARAITGNVRLAYAGGVALNSVANELIVRDGAFDEVHFMPAADDSGVAIGAAYYGLWQFDRRASGRRIVRDSFGASYTCADLAQAIDGAPALRSSGPADVIETAAELLCHGKIGGWFDGGSELGPRALGYRSILCDPRPAGMKERLNARVKHREGFRPFAPAILEEYARDWFEDVDEHFSSPFMLRVCRFLPDAAERVPAVVHADGTGRVQTVRREHNPRFYDLITAFHRRTSVPILLNTSFNVMGEPIVETPEDALWCLLATDLDFCVLGDQLVTKAESYASVLSLRPHLASERLDLALEAAPSFLVSTRWGSVRRRVSPLLLTIVRHIDGKRSGYDLLAELSRTHELTENQLTRGLCELRRAGIIRFIREPAA